MKVYMKMKMNKIKEISNKQLVEQQMKIKNPTLEREEAYTYLNIGQTIFKTTY